MTESSIAPCDANLVRRHLRFGWWSLLLFAALGVTLEVLHGFKVPLYLDLANETRRLMWTLAHAHGTLLSLVHIAFASTLRSVGDAAMRGPLALASRALQAATLAMPAGFFLGGWFTHGGDPGIGVVLVAPGGLLLLVATFVVASRLPRS